MRVLVTGNSRPWKVGASIVRALRRAGHETFMLDDRRVKRTIGWTLTQRWAVRSVKRFDPDFVILDRCHALDLETVHAMIDGRQRAMWYHDPQWHAHTGLPQVAHILGVMHLAGTVYVTGFVAQWRAHVAGARFLPAAGDIEVVPVAPDPRYASDVAFIGTGYAPERADFLMQVAAHARLRTWGFGWEPWKERLGATGERVEGEAFAKVCSSSAICLGVNPKEAHGATDYASNRIWLSILAGGFYLGQWGPGLDRLLHDGVHCAWYRDLEECRDRITRYLADAPARRRMQQAGEQFVRAHHTFDQRVRNILEGREFVNPLAAAAEGNARG